MKNNFLNKILKEIRKPMRETEINLSIPRIYFERTILPPVSNNGEKRLNYDMPFLILVSNPCRHLTKSGGCVMCGYSNLAMFRKKIKGQQVYEQFQKGFELIKKIPYHEMVAIGTPGSFLDEYEIPREIQRRIIEDLDKEESIYYINIESRAEFITKETLENIIDVMEDPYKLAIGIGLESSNEIIREKCINKNLATEEYLRAVNLLKEYNISPTIYITFGKPFLSIRNDIEDVINSINFAFDNGADRVVLLRMKIHPNTLTEHLYEKGLYKPPSLWSLLEILKNIPSTKRKDVLIANPRLPKPLEIKECECHSTVSELFRQYKGTLDDKYLKSIDEIDCKCKEKWKDELLNFENVEEEIEKAYDKLKTLFGE